MLTKNTNRTSVAVMVDSKRISQREGKWSCSRLSRRGNEGPCSRPARGSPSMKQMDPEMWALVTQRVVHGPSAARKGSAEALDTRDHLKA